VSLLRFRAPFTVGILASYLNFQELFGQRSFSLEVIAFLVLIFFVLNGSGTGENTWKQNWKEIPCSCSVLSLFFYFMFHMLMDTTTIVNHFLKNGN
jgi:hypothetical protein